MCTYHEKKELKATKDKDKNYHCYMVGYYQDIFIITLEALDFKLKHKNGKFK